MKKVVELIKVIDSSDGTFVFKVRGVLTPKYFTTLVQAEDYIKNVLHARYNYREVNIW